MTLKSIASGPDESNWIHRRSNKSRDHQIHFSPANGLPVASYASFFDYFDNQYSLSGMDFRGAWPAHPIPKNSFTWDNHADDLISAIETTYEQPVIGMGHSLGATVTILAALKRPELFSRIVAIDPATVPNLFIARLYRRLPESLVFKFAPFIRKTHLRQHNWSSREAFCDNYRTHPTYRLFTERALRDYAKYGLRQRDNGDFELVHSPSWESFNFRRVPHIWGSLRKCRIPTLLLRAQHSYIYSQQQFDRKTASLHSHIESQTIIGSHHLATHEHPGVVANQILNWL